MDTPHHPPVFTHQAAAAAHPGRDPPPSPRRQPRLTGAPYSSGRRACVSSPKQTRTSSAWPKTRCSPAGSSRSPHPADARTRCT
jgi:hypothetical protein